MVLLDTSSPTYRDFCIPVEDQRFLLDIAEILPRVERWSEVGRPSERIVQRSVPPVE